MGAGSNGSPGSTSSVSRSTSKTPEAVATWAVMRAREQRCDDRGGAPGRGERRMALRPGREVGNAERVTGAGRVAVDLEGRDLLGTPVRDDRRTARAVRQEKLPDGKGARVADRLRLLVVQLEDPHVAEKVGVEVGVEDERAGTAGADQALSVEGEPPPAGRCRERLGREVGARERCNVDEAHLVRKRRHVLRADASPTATTPMLRWSPSYEISKLAVLFPGM